VTSISPAVFEILRSKRIGGQGSFNNYVTPFLAILPLPPSCHRLSHPADSPMITSHLTNPPAPSTPVETTCRNVELLSMYVNAVIFFIFFPCFSVNFCMKLHKFSQSDRSVASHFAPTSTRPTNCGANNQLAQLACQLALPKLNRSNVMIMSNRKPNVWLVTLDTNSPHVLRRVGYWGELAVGELTVA